MKETWNDEKAPFNTLFFMLSLSIVWDKRGKDTKCVFFLIQ